MGAGISALTLITRKIHSSLTPIHHHILRTHTDKSKCCSLTHHVVGIIMSDQIPVTPLAKITNDCLHSNGHAVPIAQRYISSPAESWQPTYRLARLLRLRNTSMEALMKLTKPRRAEHWHLIPQTISLLHHMIYSHSGRKVPRPFQPPTVTGALHIVGKARA